MLKRASNGTTQSSEPAIHPFLLASDFEFEGAGGLRVIAPVGQQKGSARATYKKSEEQMKKEDAPGSLASTAPNKACKASKLTRRVKAGEQLTEDRRLRRKPERAWKEIPARPSH